MRASKLVSIHVLRITYLRMGEYLMSDDWLNDMLDEMLDESKWESIVDCKDCGHVPAHSPLCEVGA